jgi:hypothetical protein
MAWTNLGPSGVLLPLMDPIAIKDAAARLEVFIGQPAGLAFITPTTPNGPWANWAGYTTQPGSGIYVGASKDSTQCLELYTSSYGGGSSSDGSVWFTWQAEPGVTGPNSYGAWVSLGNPGVVESPAVSPGPEGALYVFVTGGGGENVSVNVGPVGGRSANGWSGWQSLGAPASLFPGTVAVASNYDTSLVVFVTTTAGVQGLWQGKADPYWQGDWQNLGAPASPYGQSTLAVTTSPNVNGQAGGLVVFVVGSDGKLYANSQQGPESTNWSGWQNIGQNSPVPFIVTRWWEPEPAAPAVGTGRNGPAVFVCGSDGNVYLIEQNGAGA